LKPAINYLREVVSDLGAGRQFAAVACLDSVAGQDQPGRTAGFCCSLQVTQRITHSRNVLETDVITPGDIVEHAWFGLAALAIVVGTVWTDEDGINVTTQLGELETHLGVHGV